MPLNAIKSPFLGRVDASMITAGNTTIWNGLVYVHNFMLWMQAALRHRRYISIDVLLKQAKLDKHELNH